MQASHHVTLLVACGMLSIEDVVSATSVLMHSWPSIAGRRKNNWEGAAGKSCLDMFLGLPRIFTAVRFLPSICGLGAATVLQVRMQMQYAAVQSIAWHLETADAGLETGMPVPFF